MADENEVVTVLKELRRFGIKGSVETTGGNHKQISWRVAPEKPERRMTVASTGSDWRGRLNARAELRRYLSNDNAEEVVTPTRKVTPTTVARSIFKPHDYTDPVQAQLADIRLEMSDITSLLLDISSRLSDALPQRMRGDDVHGRDQNLHTIDAVPFVGFVTTDQIARQFNINRAAAYQRLYYLKGEGRIEQRGDSWRRVPDAEIAVTPAEAGVPTLVPNNGHVSTDEPVEIRADTPPETEPADSSEEEIAAHYPDDPPAWWPKRTPKGALKSPLWHLLLTGERLTIYKAMKETNLREHEVRSTLTKWKNDGFVINPERGVWCMYGAPEPAPAPPPPAVAVEAPTPAPALASGRPSEIPFEPGAIKTVKMRRQVSESAIWKVLQTDKALHVSRIAELSGRDMDIRTAYSTLHNWKKRGYVANPENGYWVRVAEPQGKARTRDRSATALSTGPKGVAGTRIRRHPVWQYLADGPKTATRAAIAKAVGMDFTAVSSALWYWQNRGYVVRKPGGEYAIAPGAPEAADSPPWEAPPPTRPAPEPEPVEPRPVSVKRRLDPRFERNTLWQALSEDVPMDRHELHRVTGKSYRAAAAFLQGARAKGLVSCDGRGPGAKWRKLPEQTETVVPVAVPVPAPHEAQPEEPALEPIVVSHLILKNPLWRFVKAGKPFALADACRAFPEKTRGTISVTLTSWKHKGYLTLNDGRWQLAPNVVEAS